jgi:uncharacterized protein (DUF1800 family)
MMESVHPLQAVRRTLTPHPELPRVRALAARARLARGSLPGARYLRSLPLARPDQRPIEDPIRLLLRRLSMGFDQAEYERARDMGYDAYLEEQLDPAGLPDPDMDARLASYQTLHLTPAELQTNWSDQPQVAYDEVKKVVVQRALHSRRQLLERTCEFWNDHFSVDHQRGEVQWVWMGEKERLVTRPNALGSFPTLLAGTAFNASMLHYLDNWLNTTSAPQENFARELLELHTLGVRGGYTEVDVVEVAKCFTGWTLLMNDTSPDWLRGIFVPIQHSPGLKLVLGQVIGNDPPRLDAQKVLDILAAHPSTAEFLARKLLRWFLTPHPPDELVTRVAGTYLATGGDIRAMLRVILARESLAHATPKFRRPFHFVVSLLRGLGADVQDALATVLLLSDMGQMPFGYPMPDGYPDTVEAWGAALLPRWDFASLLLTPSLTGEPIPGVHLSLESVQAKLDFTGPAERHGLAGRIDARVLGQRLAPQELVGLQDFIDGYPGPFGGEALLETIALAASLPGAQWY